MSKCRRFIEWHECSLGEAWPRFSYLRGYPFHVLYALSMQTEVTVTIQAPVETVWEAYTTPKHIEQWNFASDDWQARDAKVDLREGGEFSSRMEAKDGSAGFLFGGTYTKIITNELIEYSFGDRMASVSFAEGPQGVVVSVSFDLEDQNSAEMQKAGWQAILNNFALHVSTL